MKYFLYHVIINRILLPTSNYIFIFEFSYLDDISLDVPLVRPPDFKPEFDTKCVSRTLSTSPDINYRFGFKPFNSSSVLPGDAAEAFHFFPQVF
jgi:hypothetical protein